MGGKNKENDKRQTKIRAIINYAIIAGFMFKNRNKNWKTVFFASMRIHLIKDEKKMRKRRERERERECSPHFSLLLTIRVGNPFEHSLPLSLSLSLSPSLSLSALLPGLSYRTNSWALSAALRFFRSFCSKPLCPPQPSTLSLSHKFYFVFSSSTYLHS